MIFLVMCANNLPDGSGAQRGRSRVSACCRDPGEDFASVQLWFSKSRLIPRVHMEYREAGRFVGLLSMIKKKTKKKQLAKAQAYKQLCD